MYPGLGDPSRSSTIALFSDLPFALPTNRPIASEPSVPHVCSQRCLSDEIEMSVSGTYTLLKQDRNARVAPPNCYFDSAPALALHLSASNFT